MWRPLAWLAVLALASAPAVASGADAVLVPHAAAADPSLGASSALLEELVVEVMRDNEFVVLTHEVATRALGPILDGCEGAARAGCALTALNSTPARLAVLLTVQGTPDRPMLAVDFVGEASSEPIRQMVLPIEPGKERRVALQVTMFALDVSEDLGPATPSLLDAARRLTGVAPTARAEPPVARVEDLLAGEEDDDLDLDPDVPPAPRDVPPAPDGGLAGGVLPVGPVAPSPGPAVRDRFEPLERSSVRPGAAELPPRLFAGSRRSYEARRTDAETWLAEKRPHAGRALIELRGGVVIGDVSRVATVLGEPGSQEGALVTSFIQEAPLYDLVGRAELFIGYAPATVFDLGVLVGVNFARDEITLGYMREGQAPTLGAPERLQVARPYLQPRLRATFVPVGVVKPYAVAGAELTFVSDWSFEVTTIEPFPRPRGGVMVGILGGGGLSFDPMKRLGILVEATGVRYVGALSGVRFEGVVVGGTPDPLPGVRRWSVGIVAGLQVRL